MTENLVFGIRPVVEAIEAGKQIEKTLHSQRRRRAVDDRTARPLPAASHPHTGGSRQRSSTASRAATTKGVVAQISPIGYVELNDILERVPEDETPLIVLFDGVTDVRNFGAIARSAECAGAHGLIVPLKNAAPVNSGGDSFVGGCTDRHSRLPRRFDPATRSKRSRQKATRW